MINDVIHLDIYTYIYICKSMGVTSKIHDFLVLFLFLLILLIF